MDRFFLFPIILLFSLLIPRSSIGREGAVVPQSGLEGGVSLDTGVVGRSVELKLPGGVPITFQYCPPGEFTMGSPEEEEGRYEDENQVHVRITKGYWLGRMEVTQAQWRAVMKTEPSRLKGEHLPVEMVTWNGARQFAAKMNERGGLPAGWKWALPTEAQWEYACRAGRKTVFTHGDSLGSLQANLDGTAPYGTAPKGASLEKTTTVGKYAPNAWGLHDMHGNVSEWCADRYAEKLPGGVDPVGPDKGLERVFRGGSWGSPGADCRAACRQSSKPDEYGNLLGFRVALVPSE